MRPTHCICFWWERTTKYTALSDHFDICFFVGVWLGVWMNRRIPAQKFTHIICVIVLLTGIELVSGKSLLGWLLK